MYNVAQVIDEKCVAKKGCRLCIMYCPEANCLDLNSNKMVAEVFIDRCKGCELCVIVCDAAKCSGSPAQDPMAPALWGFFVGAGVEGTDGNRRQCH